MITKLTVNEVFVKLLEMKLMHQNTIKFNDKKFIYLAPKEEVYYNDYIDFVENNTSDLTEAVFTNENNLRIFINNIDESLEFDYKINLYVGIIKYGQNS